MGRQEGHGCCFAVAAVPALAAGDVAGQQKAIACAACHGQQGLAVPRRPQPGRPAGAIPRPQLRAYRGGTRQHEVMTLMAKPLTDADIENLSAWFSSQKIALRANP